MFPPPNCSRAGGAARRLGELESSCAGPVMQTSVHYPSRHARRPARKGGASRNLCQDREASNGCTCCHQVTGRRGAGGPAPYRPTAYASKSSQIIRGLSIRSRGRPTILADSPYASLTEDGSWSPDLSACGGTSARSKIPAASTAASTSCWTSSPSPSVPSSPTPTTGKASRPSATTAGTGSRPSWSCPMASPPTTPSSASSTPSTRRPSRSAC